VDSSGDRRRRRWPYVLVGGLLAFAALSGASLGYFLRLDLPNVRALEEYTPNVMTRVLASDGQVVDTFAEQRRILIDYREIPGYFREALIATEDKNFQSHPGIDFQGVLRAAWADVRDLKLSEGASTLTMQLARDLFLHRQKTWSRKIREALLALEIERYYTKEEILSFYCNQVYMGHGRYGLEAASRYYLDKPARELTLPESALLAGIIQRPEALTPVRHPERALSRRNHVLSRMVAEGYLTPEEAQVAKDTPIELPSDRNEEDHAPYFVEDVRRWLKTSYGDTSVYKEGLEVYTTLDTGMQSLANRAVDLGLRELDKRQGWRGVVERVPDGEDPGSWEPASWAEGVIEGRVTDGVVVQVDGDQARVRVGTHVGTLGSEEIGWTRRKKPSSILKVGDVPRVRLESVGEDGRAKITLEQEPLVEAALVALDPRTGEVLALVGGFDFHRSEWDRATQSQRQTGSAFKPFVYAASLALGKTLSDRILDEPTVFLDPYSGAAYQPENYTNKYYGTLTLRRALEKSANIATVKLLDEIGYDEVIEFARRLGISSEMHPYPSLALGVFGVSLLELTSAYGSFANQGVWVEPHLVREVRDHGGALLTQVEPEVRDAVSPQIAYLINRSLEGVITDGTGKAARSLGRPLAGKTGTTDFNTDAWFIGYAPDLVVGVWVGFDDYTSLGTRETGALAALPIWKRFMEAAYQGRPVEEFARPSGITFVSVDRETGLRANPAADCRPTYSEVFVSGTEPTRYCNRHEHRLLQMPSALQRFPVGERGRIRIPSAELDELLANDLSLYISADGTELVSRSAEGNDRFPLARTPGGDVTVLPARVREKVHPEEWVGKDGRRARVVLLRR
jgi:penicillin-binding protein 1A